MESRTTLLLLISSLIFAGCASGGETSADDDEPVATSHVLRYVGNGEYVEARPSEHFQVTGNATAARYEIDFGKMLVMGQLELWMIRAEGDVNLTYSYQYSFENVPTVPEGEEIAGNDICAFKQDLSGAVEEFFLEGNRDARYQTPGNLPGYGSGLTGSQTSHDRLDDESNVLARGFFGQSDSFFDDENFWHIQIDVTGAHEFIFLEPAPMACGVGFGSIGAAYHDPVTDLALDGAWGFPLTYGGSTWYDPWLADLSGGALDDADITLGAETYPLEDPFEHTDAHAERLDLRVASYKGEHPWGMVGLPYIF